MGCGSFNPKITSPGGSPGLPSFRLRGNKACKAHRVVPMQQAVSTDDCSRGKMLSPSAPDYTLTVTNPPCDQEICLTGCCGCPLDDVFDSPVDDKSGGINHILDQEVC